MLGSFQILDVGQPRRNQTVPRSTGEGYFRARKRRSSKGAGWSGLRGHRRFDWTVEDVFLPERGRCPTPRAAGQPMEARPGITYALPAQAWVGPHHSAVITASRGRHRRPDPALRWKTRGPHRLAL